MADRRNQRMLAPIGLGIEFAAILVVLTVIGLWVDRHYSTAPWGSLIGAGAGLAGGGYNFLKGAKRVWQDSSPSSTGSRLSETLSSSTARDGEELRSGADEVAPTGQARNRNTSD